MAELLPFEHEMLVDVRGENCLCISAKGLANDRLLSNLAYTYSNTLQLVFIIGIDAECKVEQESVVENVREYHARQASLGNEDDELGNYIAPREFDYETAMAARRESYLDGGVIFITSRILISDMLNYDHPFPYESVSGIIVVNAHRVADDCNLAFILRLYRENNRTGFITALSQNAQSFEGFSKLEKVMRALFANKLFLWPRFNASISNTFEQYPVPEVLEYRVHMTPAMKQIQFALMEIISKCLTEFARIWPHDNEEKNLLNVISVVSRDFRRFVEKNYNSKWFAMGPQAHLNIKDIQQFKDVLFSLIELDAVSFYNKLQRIREAAHSSIMNQRVHDWLFWSQTETLYKLTQERVYVHNPRDPKDTKKYYNIEANPKHDTLDKLLKQIEDDNLDFGELDILLVVEKQRTANKIGEIVSKGLSQFMTDLDNDCKTLHNATLLGVKQNASNEDLEQEANTLSRILERFDECETMSAKRNSLNVHFYISKADKGYGLGLKNMLQAFKPQHIILYDPEIACIRQIEIFQAVSVSANQAPMKVHLLIFDGSVEEQRYLHTIELEKAAFEKLIDEKSKLAKSNDLRLDLTRGEPSMYHPEEEEELLGNSRRGGLHAKKRFERRQVLADVREFRSHLPMAIHTMDIDLWPVTLEIGDYLLTPDTCVERKAIPDLVNSLREGRLYTQAQCMVRYYRRSILLIEFNRQESFSFRSRSWTYTAQPGSHGKPSPLVQLALLTTHFPQLRLIWSPSPEFSAQMFAQLKHDKPEPSPKDIVDTRKGNHQQLPVEQATDRYDHEAMEFLLALPGVNSSNVYGLMNKCGSIRKMVKCSLAGLKEALGSEQCAKLLHAALHGPLNAKEGNLKSQPSRIKKFSYARRKK